jgi:peptidylprolyl isomerase
VVIQLMPEPFSQGWVGNVRKLAAAHWWDGLTVYRVQDNWVSQWGDADGEDKAKAKPLPSSLEVVPQSEYVATYAGLSLPIPGIAPSMPTSPKANIKILPPPYGGLKTDNYAPLSGLTLTGWPVAASGGAAWPVHCYGSIGVARDMPPDTGTGAELYVAIGHAPRQLDRNLAVVGRVIEGMQFMSSLPRGPAPLGVYADPAERTPILSVHPAREVADLPTYEYLSTESASFSHYAEASANHREPFYVQPAGGIDICNLKVPVRRRK